MNLSQETQRMQNVIQYFYQASVYLLKSTHQTTIFTTNSEDVQLFLLDIIKKYTYFYTKIHNNVYTFLLQNRIQVQLFFKKKTEPSTTIFIKTE